MLKSNKRVSWFRHHQLLIRMMILLGGLNFLTGMGIVYLKHESRQIYSQLQLFDEQREALQIEWSQLLLEQGAWGADARVERIARDQLNMRVPHSKEIVVLQ